MTCRNNATDRDRPGGSSRRYRCRSRPAQNPPPPPLGAPLLSAAIHDLFPWLRHLFADTAYAGDKLFDTQTKFGNWTIEVVRRMADAGGFEILPRRWVVERTLAWLNRNRRLAKDFEATIASAKAWLYLASVQLLVRRLAGERNNLCGSESDI
jgi:transposase